MSNETVKIEVGQTLPTLTVASVSPETMKVWAPILRDPNPIHLDRAAVKAMGLGDRLINQGPINLGYCINMLMAAFPGARLVRFANRFVDNVYEADALEATGEITGIEQKDGKTLVSCSFVLRAQERDLVVTGTATLELVAVP